MACSYTLRDNKSNKVITFTSEKALDNYLKLHYTEFEGLINHAFRFSKDYTNILSSDYEKSKAILDKDREAARAAKKKKDTVKTFASSGSNIYDVIESDDATSGGYVSVLNYIAQQGFVKALDRDAYTHALESEALKEVPSDAQNKEAILLETRNYIEKVEFPYWQYLQEIGRGFHYIFDQIINAKPGSNVSIEMIQSIFRSRFRKDFVSGKNVTHIDGVSDKALKSFITQITALKKNIIDNKNRGRKAIKVFTEYIADHNGGEGNKIRGKIDLLVVYEDQEGNQSVEIYDLKLSTKPEDRWDSDKKNAIQYQLGFYKRMLQEKGIPARNISMKVIPVLLEDVNKEDLSHAIGNVNVGEPITYIPSVGQQTKIEQSIPIPIGKELVSKPLLETVAGVVSKFFPVSKINQIDAIDFDVLYKDKKYGVSIDPSTGRYRFEDTTRSKKEHRFIYADTEEEIKDAFKDYLRRKSDHDNDVTNTISKDLKFALDRINGNMGFNPNRASLNVVPSGTYEDVKGLLELNLSKYKLEPDWEVMINESLTSMNIIMLVNKSRKEMDFISLSPYPLDNVINLGKGTSLMGRFKTNSQMELDKLSIKASIGNIELIKLMAVANSFSDTDLGDFSIGELKTINIDKSEVVYSYINQDKLIHNYNMLADAAGLKRNGFKFTDMFTTVMRYYQSIANNDLQTRLKGITELSPDGDLDSLSKAAKYEELKSMFKNLQSRFFSGNVAPDINNPITFLYLQVANALTQYGNTAVDIFNDELWNKHFGDVFKQLKDGSLFNGTYLNTIDTTPIVRSIAARLSATNRNITNRYEAYKNKDRQITNKYYKGAGQGFVGKTILNNATVMFKRLLDNSEEGKKKFKVKNPWNSSSDLNPAEREYLKYWLEDLNRMRFPNQSREELGERYFEIPLLRGSSWSKIVNGKNSLATFKEDGALEMVNPRMTTTEQERYISEDSLKTLVEMYNVFDASNSIGAREGMLASTNGKPEQVYETNLEHIKDMYQFSLIRKEEMDEILPAVNAAIVSLQFVQTLSHKDAKATIDFLNEYIKSSVFDESLVPKESRGMYKLLGMAKGVSTNFILGFNYLSGAKETITGFFNLYEKAIANSLTDKDRIGVKDMTSAYTTVWVDSAKQVGTITLLEHLNWQYRMANVDMNALVDRMNYEITDGLRFKDRMFWANRAPDFLNRMTILVGYMKKHGCYDAHTLLPDGTVKYDWKKDRRFNLLANPNADINSAEWQYQRSLYNRMIESFIASNIKVVNPDGTTRTLTTEKDSRGVYKDALPQAYTEEEAKMIKQESDSMFGYMDHDTKSLYLKKGLFLFLHQFQTFLSAKKNQWFLKRGVYDYGHWVHLTENPDGTGAKLYWKTIENPDGTIERIKTTENTGEPIIDWQGKIMEGIFWSLKDLFNFTNPKLAAEAWRDPVKRRNLILALEDMAIIGFIALIIALLFGDKEKNSLSPAEQNVVRLANNIGGEFNMFKIFTGAVDFKMPMFQFYGEVFTDGVKVLTGDKHVLRMLTDNTGTFRPLKPTVMEYFQAPNSQK